MMFQVINVFSVGDNTVVTLDAFGIGVNLQKPIIDDTGKKFKIIGIGMDAGEEPGRRNPISIFVQGKFTGKKADVTIIS